MKKCVFAGTFDPPTTGHAQVIENCLKIFDETVVAVMVNHDKAPLFSVEERLYLLGKLYGSNPAVRIISFEGTAADLLERENTPFYARGIRNTVDFEYENRNNFATKKLKPDLIPVYFPAEQESLHISSTLVKNLYKFKKDFSQYVPEQISADVLKILNAKEK